ncbi:MAG: preprotein translocase subunit SecA [Alphaproteobacteria bacterium GM7ARS4]|nr:preprotein translocase subunit SecA [Alphaproteobacteria bacterium GM7ARS4]
MWTSLMKRFVGDPSSRFIKKLEPVADAIEAKGETMRALSDDALRAYSDDLRRRVCAGESLSSVLVEAFAVVREAAWRTLRQKHYHVQLIGGMILHHGRIAEMKTGEGKTLVSTLAVYVNALCGKGVHVVTVNDYLAKRDSEWMGQIYRFLGLSVGCLTHAMPFPERKKAYLCDVLYATNNELGFDYLRDNMAHRVEEQVQRPFHYAIIDEVDSILIDEARTPLIISGASSDSSREYQSIDPIIGRLTPQDYEKDEKGRAVTLTESGVEAVEKALTALGLLDGGLYDIGNMSLVHHVTQALKAHTLFHRDVDYIVRDGAVFLIDEFTGRVMEGRRFSEGLHQALEAKEGVTIQAENQTLASITFQNYFRLYPRLAGMTGTAMTERDEFLSIYGMKVVSVPTHQLVARVDKDDEIYRRHRDKIVAIVLLIKECHERGQPVLVGTVSIEKSEALSSRLKDMGIRHHVLNARYHEQEAQIIARAGCYRAVTIATNMAGRGTDIQLGGNIDMMLRDGLATIKDEAALKAKERDIRKEHARAKERVIEAGGLYVIGTERHEARRIDNQLRGRSGRQGDPGASQFFLSLEDDLMRIFGGERLEKMMERFGVVDDEAITHPWVNKAIASAQRKVEARNFEIRKHLLRFDDVMSEQRHIVYEQRREYMHAEAFDDILLDMRRSQLEELVDVHTQHTEERSMWDVETLQRAVLRLSGVDIPFSAWIEALAHGDGDDTEALRTSLKERVVTHVDDMYASKRATYGEEMMKRAEKAMFLQMFDHVWKEHLSQLDYVRQGINLRAYAQKDPLHEYKREAFNLFSVMLERFRENIVMATCHMEMASGDTSFERVERHKAQEKRVERRPQLETMLGDMATNGVAGGGKVRQGTRLEGGKTLSRVPSRHQRRRAASFDKGKGKKPLRRKPLGGRI